MKIQNFGWKWLLQLTACTTISLLWVLVVYPGASNHNHFEQLIPGIQILVADTGILLLGAYVSFKLSPVLSNNILRKIWIRQEILNAGLIALLGYYFLTNLYPEIITVINSCNRIDLTTDKLSTHIHAFAFDFWWTLVARLILPVGIVVFPVEGLELWQKIKDMPFYRSAYIEGKGGGSKWASLYTFKRFRGKISRKLHNDRILLGRALFTDDPRASVICADKESHHITIAGTGAGKSVSFLYNQLCQWGHSALVIDPKAELTNQTYRTRACKSWLEQNSIKGKTYRHKEGDARCYLLDPFSENKDLPKARYNVLSEIDIHSDRIREMLSAISDGCVLPETKDVHFVEMAKYFIEGLIAHVLTRYPKENQNLAFIYDLMNGIVDPDLNYADPTQLNSLLKSMMMNDAAGGLPQQAASKLSEAGDRELGGILTTVARSLKWCSDPAMRIHLSSSDFSFSELRERTTTVYVVLPDALMNSQTRWLRTLISISLIAVKKQETISKRPVAFILDELPRLGGKIQAVADGFALLRSYGVRIVALIQVLDQLKKDYPTYDAMLGNATVQVYGISSLSTSEWVSSMLGNAVHKKEVRKGQAKQVEEFTRPLLTPSEVRIKLARNANRSIVFSEGYPMRLERCSYKPMKIGGKRFFEFRPFAFKGCFEDW